MNAGLTALVVVGALAVSALGGWGAVAGLLRVASRSPDSGPVDADDPPPSQPVTPGGWVPPGPVLPPEPARATEPDEPGPLRGGTWIGVLERVAVTGVLLAGYPAGVAFVIAIKGLGRYPELREHPGSSERFVIGTLGSLVWAAGCGILGAVLLGTSVLAV
ncbi:hypothetical protein [uncultured Cellulomonas sp.]|uniref:hypothetical protein n=1 Tax=uncultured Cellulomonas sp. TaxID=189682 RepID=UPI0026314E48|nr:hypothetical protein [uncultured Cellulomonas sp.]